MCPRVVPTASITLGSFIWAFVSLHWWDFPVPLGGVSRLEQLSQGIMPPVRPQATAGGIRGAVIRRGPHSERK